MGQFAVSDARVPLLKNFPHSLPRLLLTLQRNSKLSLCGSWQTKASYYSSIIILSIRGGSTVKPLNKGHVVVTFEASSYSEVT